MVPTLGASLALSGPEAEYGRQSRVAIEMAIADAGLRVDLRVEDDGSDPALALTAARSLAEVPGLIGVVGPMNSWTASVQAPAFADAGIAQITHSASSPDLDAGRWPTFRRMCPADDLQGSVLAAVAARLLGARRVAAIGDGTSFAESLNDRFVDRARELGLARVPDEGPATATPAGDDGRERRLEAVAAAGADAILISGLEAACRDAAKALRKLGCAATFLGTDAIKPTQVLVTEGATHDGPYLTCSCVDARRQAPEFHARFEDRYGSHDSVYTVEAYDAARVLLEAWSRAPELAASATSPRQAVLSAIEEIDEIEGLVGPVAFDGSGERRDPTIGVYRHQDGDLRYLGTHEEVIGT